MIKRTKIEDYQTDANNANKGNERGRALVKKSIGDYGAGRSVLADRNGVLIAGNKTVEAARAAGIEDVIEVETDGKALILHKRLDLDLLEGGAARELAYADNRTSEVGLTWDVEQIAADIDAGVNLDGYFLQDEIEAILSDVENETAPNSPGDPGESRYKEQYGVIVICESESHQEGVYNTLVEMGYNVRVVVT